MLKKSLSIHGFLLLQKKRKKKENTNDMVFINLVILFKYHKI